MNGKARSISFADKGEYVVSVSGVRICTVVKCGFASAQANACCFASKKRSMTIALRSAALRPHIGAALRFTTSGPVSRPPTPHHKTRLCCHKEFLGIRSRAPQFFGGKALGPELICPTPMSRPKGSVHKIGSQKQGRLVPSRCSLVPHCSEKLRSNLAPLIGG
jgi:hypothetical protein